MVHLANLICVFAAAMHTYLLFVTVFLLAAQCLLCLDGKYLRPGSQNQDDRDLLLEFERVWPEVVCFLDAFDEGGKLLYHIN